MKKPIIVLLGLTVAAAVGQAIHESPAAQGAAIETAEERVKLSGEFRRQAGVDVFVASDAMGSAMTVTNPEKIPQNALGIPVTASVDRGAAGVEVDSFKLAVTARWEDDRHRFADVEFDALRSAHANFDQVARSWLSSPAPTDASQVKAALEQVKRPLLDAYSKRVDADDDLSRLILEQFRDLIRTGKAIYGYNDIYPPETYERIFESSRGSVGLFRGTEATPFCSGVLISDDLVLSCRHCLNTASPSETKVKFDYERRIDGTQLTPREYTVAELVTQGRKVAHSEALLDYALYRLKPDADGNKAGERFPAQCLSTDRVRLDDPLYVVGHPERLPRSVHDNAFVYYPFRAPEAEFKEIRARLDLQFGDPAEKPARVTEFLDSYQRRTGPSPGEVFFENYSLRWGGQPTIGADCDTFHGNSGSPVHHRRNHLVVGLLFHGEPDVSEPYRPGWKSHEAILPITEIIQQLDEAVPNWRNESGVCIQ